MRWNMWTKLRVISILIKNLAINDISKSGDALGSANQSDSSEGN